MSRIKVKDSLPELALRRLMQGKGYRYRLHVTGLPGRPDLVFPARKKAIFMHGCFWQRHKGCALARMPKSRRDFGKTKLKANKSLDARTT